MPDTFREMMMPTLTNKPSDRAELYLSTAGQLKALVDGETDLISNLANLSALLHERFGFHWVGAYRVIGEELVLGPFQGPVACSRIARGKGVCGTAWAEDRTQLVPDVDQFPGHIACSADSRSEIVVPIHGQGGQVIAVLDVDSAELNGLNELDVKGLQELVKILESTL